MDIQFEVNMLNQYVNTTDFVRYVTSDMSAATGNREAEPMKHTANGDYDNVERGLQYNDDDDDNNNNNTFHRRKPKDGEIVSWETQDICMPCSGVIFRTGGRSS